MNYLQKLYKAENLMSVNNNLCGKLVSSLESAITFGERFKVTSIPFFIPDFNQLSCELENVSVYGLSFIKLSNAFVFPDPEPQINDILYRLSGICSQFGLCCFTISFVYNQS